MLNIFGSPNGDQFSPDYQKERLNQIITEVFATNPTTAEEADERWEELERRVTSEIGGTSAALVKLSKVTAELFVLQGARNTAMFLVELASMVAEHINCEDSAEGCLMKGHKHDE